MPVDERVVLINESAVIVVEPRDGQLEDCSRGLSREPRIEAVIAGPPAASDFDHRDRAVSFEERERDQQTAHDRSRAHRSAGQQRRRAERR